MRTPVDVSEYNCDFLRTTILHPRNQGQTFTYVITFHGIVNIRNSVQHSFADFVFVLSFLLQTCFTLSEIGKAGDSVGTDKLWTQGDKLAVEFVFGCCFSCNRSIRWVNSDHTVVKIVDTETLNIPDNVSSMNRN